MSNVGVYLPQQIYENINPPTRNSHIQFMLTFNMSLTKYCIHPRDRAHREALYSALGDGGGTGEGGGGEPSEIEQAQVAVKWIFFTSVFQIIDQTCIISYVIV